MKSIVLIASAFFAFQVQAKTLTTEDYVDQWKITAIEQMNAHQIPASITLAQGILESGNGNSKLAVEANNHFGIKCHKTWTGDTFFQDDDKKNECFRSYESAAQSYEDHSMFLVGRSRYADLFTLKLTDYKGWAKGLKSAGYATNPKYADLLINIIEKYQLDEFDKMPNLPYEQKKDKDLAISNSEKQPTTEIKSKPTTNNEHEINYYFNDHQVMLSDNHVRYIIAQDGDTFYKIAKEFELTLGQLHKYNEFSRKDVLKAGDVVYVAPKKSKARKGHSVYVCETDMSYRDVAHKEGIKLKKILQYNLAQNPDETLPKGTKVILR